MICPECQHTTKLTWSRYLRSLSGRHVCPYCETTFRFRITFLYLRLWLDVLAGSVITGVVIKTGLTHLVIPSWDERMAFTVAACVSATLWGSYFLIANRRELDKLSCRVVSRVQ